MFADQVLSPQAKAAKVTWLLIQHGELTLQEIMSLTGLSDIGVRYLMDNLSIAQVPVWKPAPGQWRLLRDEEGLIPLDIHEGEVCHGC